MKTAMDIPDKEGRKRLVIVGGGFGGLKLARKLKSDKYQVVLLDKNNHHIFQPLLYQVATAGIEPSAISFPYRKIFKKRDHFHIRICEAQRVIPENDLLETSIGTLAYDYRHRMRYKLFWQQRYDQADHGSKEYIGSPVQP